MKTEQQTYDELMNAILAKCKFRYFSYDHKSALKEYKDNPKYKAESKIWGDVNCHYMPDELKEKYKTEKIGKIREIHFNPKGEACKFKIGAKFAKTFHLKDFGVSVFIMPF